MLMQLQLVERILLLKEQHYSEGEGGRERGRERREGGRERRGEERGREGGREQLYSKGEKRGREGEGKRIEGPFFSL